MRYILLLLLLLFILFKVAIWNLGRTANYTFRENALKAPYDAIIIPGFPLDTSKIHRIIKVRMYWAKKLLESGITRNIIFSGAAVNSPYVEGVYMKILADSLGMTKAHLFSETQALHGDENVIYGMNLAKKLGFKKVAIATDPFQFAYLRYLIFKEGIDFLPFPPDSMKAFEQPLPKADFSPAFVKNFVPLKERNKSE